VGLEGRLRDFGIQESDMSSLVDGALRQERLLSYNFKVPNREDVEGIYRAAL
jgi:alcohol dehydrogenase class IV